MSSHKENTSNALKASFVRQHVLKAKFRKPAINITCDVCQKEFWAISESNFNQHYRSHFNQKKNIKEKNDYNCEECKKAFGNNKINYERHMQINTKKIEESKETTTTKKKEIEYTCELCGKFMKTFSPNIRNHLNACEQKNKVTECTICEKKIKGKSNFEMHRKKCLKENAISDSETDSPVKKMPKKHHECKFCGKKFMYGDNFRRHRTDCNR